MPFEDRAARIRREMEAEAEKQRLQAQQLAEQYRLEALTRQQAQNKEQADFLNSSGYKALDAIRRNPEFQEILFKYYQFLNTQRTFSMYQRELDPFKPQVEISRDLVLTATVKPGYHEYTLTQGILRNKKKYVSTSTSVENPLLIRIAFNKDTKTLKIERGTWREEKDDYEQYSSTIHTDWEEFSSVDELLDSITKTIVRGY